MPAQQPPDLPDALSRFRSVTDAAVERGRRILAEARESGAVAERQAAQHAERQAAHPAEPSRPTSPDLRAAAADFRRAAGLPIPDPPAEPTRPGTQPPPEDDDFSQKKIMYKLG